MTNSMDDYHPLRPLGSETQDLSKRFGHVDPLEPYGVRSLEPRFNDYGSPVERYFLDRAAEAKKTLLS